MNARNPCVFRLFRVQAGLLLTDDILLQVAIFNGTLFTGTIGVFFWILIHNAQRRHEVIADAIHFPLPGCPSVHSGIEWAQWVPGWSHLSTEELLLTSDYFSHCIRSGLVFLCCLQICLFSIGSHVETRWWS